MKKILLSLLTVMMLTGCMGNVYLNDRGIVQAVGIDYADGEYSLTMELFNVEESSADQGASGAKSKIIKSQGKSITEAIQKTALSEGKIMFFGNCKVIVLGEETAREGVSKALDYFNSTHETPPTILVLTARGKAEDILSTKEEEPIVPGKEILDMVEAAQKSGFSPQSRLMDIIGDIQEPNISGTLCLIEAQEEKEKPVLSLAGLAVFREDRMISTLPLEQCRGLQWIKGKIKATEIYIKEDRIGQITAVTSQTSSKKNANISGDHPEMIIKIKVKSTAVEAVLNSGSPLSKEDQEYVTKLQEQLIRSEVLELIQATQRKGLDVLGLAQHVKKSSPEFYLGHQNDWKNIVENANYQVEVTCEMDRMGVGNKLL